MNPFYVLDGGIGAGKTTLGQSLVAHGVNGQSVIFLEEYSNPALLKVYIGNMKKYAFAFQLAMLIKRLEIYREARRLTDEGKLVFVDRSLEGDMAFFQLQREMGNISAEEEEVYRATMAADSKNWGSFVNIQLACTAELSLKRIGRRARQGENSYTLDYLEKLAVSYEKSTKNHLVIDWNPEHVVINGLLSAEQTSRFVELVMG